MRQRRELRIASVSAIIVANRSLDSRSEWRFSKNAINKRRCSHTPPKWAVDGVFRRHLTLGICSVSVRAVSLKIIGSSFFWLNFAENSCLRAPTN